MSKKLTERSKYLAYILRHNPASANLTLSPEGWVRVEDVVRNTDLTLEELDEIVRTDTKGRYTIVFDGLNDLIRANQGHSTDEVNLTFTEIVPPCDLYHGTTVDAWESIKTQGLKPMSRHHVHLSGDVETAQTVANRRKKDTVILRVNAARMALDGIKFFRSENGVYLVDAVPAKYLHLDYANDHVHD